MKTTEMPAAGPDEGYAWMIVFCCAFIQFSMFGVFRSAGLLYVAILGNFEASREEASWAFSTCSAMFDLAGPLVSVLTRFMSIRKVSFIGSAVATVGLALCYLATNITWINVCFGFVYGTGVGISTSLPPIVIDQYFKRHRTTALGMSFSGVCISCFVFPPLMEYLLQMFGLQGMFLILSGIVMNTFVASALFREPPWLAKESSTATNGAIKKVKFAAFKDDDRSGNTAGNAARENFVPVPENDISLEYSIPVSSKIAVKADNERIETFPKPEVNCAYREPAYIERANHFEESNRIQNEKCSTDQRTDETFEPLLTGNISSVVSVVKTDDRGRSCKLRVQSLLKDTKELLCHPTFYVISVSSAVFYLLFISFLVVIADYATDEGVEETSYVYILSTFSLVDMAGRCGLGWLTDRQLIKTSNLFIINAVAIGVMLQLYPLADSLVKFCAVAGVHGLFSGSSITIIYILQAEFAGTRKMALIVGLVHFVNGIVSFVRPPMIGLFRDVVGSYDWMFRILGFLSFLTAVMWIIEPKLKKTNQLNYLPNNLK